MNSTDRASISQSSRFWTLDAVRGLAVLAVVCFHILPALDSAVYRTDPSTIWISWLRCAGPLGVCAFFVLSGFSVHLSHTRRLANKQTCYLSWGKFFCRRFWRLYPAYSIAIGLSLTLNVTWALMRGRNPLAHWPSSWDLLSHLLLLHTLRPETFFGIIPALWFMGVQAHLYLLYPVFYWFSQRWDIHRALLVTLLCTLAFRLSVQIIDLPPTVHPDLKFVLWMNAPQRWFEWCFGAWVAQRVDRGIRPRLKYAWVFFFLTTSWISTGSALSVIYEPVLSCLLGFFLWCLVTQEECLFPHPVWLPILYLGQFSYSVYLLHQIFVPYIRSAVEHSTFNAASRFAVILGLVLVITLPLAAFFHQWLESPPNKLKQKQ